ncbi:hypothetical protein MANY_34220 [Mycolicibacterium anyangense]|uniref:Pilus biosynthesis protein TadE n=1 Tax=Mycolicibacterium anyangense TaxID=1431246 RepID=A0A6N4WBE4_9MYCO|nr:hypothetical protein MANY_34220 [Mycolicibacterium anyangense]
MVVVLVCCVGGVTAISAQLRCVDAAREAARLAARGDTVAADAAARRVAPPGAGVELRRTGGFVEARVSSRSALLPGIVISAGALAATEPGQ